MPFNSMVDQFLNPDEYKHIGGTYTEESEQPTVTTLNDHAKDKILSMYKEGKNQSDIARALNIRPHVVRGYLYNYHPKLIRSKPFLEMITTKPKQ